MSENKGKSFRSWVSSEQSTIKQMLKDNPVVEVDMADVLANPEKSVKSLKVNYNGEWFWKALSRRNGEDYDVWVSNTKDPRIINTVTGRMRGRLQWVGVGGNPSGKPVGAVNRKTVKSVCDQYGVHPMELAVALMSKDRKVLRKYGIYEKEFKSITVAQQLKTAFYLGDKLQANLKPAEMGLDGEARLGGNSQESLEDAKDLVQVYLPEKGSHVEIAVSEAELNQINQLGTEKFMEEHKDELLVYDKGNPDDVLTWEDTD